MNTEYSDAELIAAMARSIEIGDAIEVTDEWLAAQRAELDAGALMLGPITLIEDTPDDYTAEQVWGVNPHNGDAVFVSRTHESFLLAGEKGKPWTAKLWIGWEDGARAGYHRSDDNRYATREEAIEAVRRRCIGWYRYLGDPAQAAEFKS